jgi:hypothetical protein
MKYETLGGNFLENGNRDEAKKAVNTMTRICQENTGEVMRDGLKSPQRLRNPPTPLSSGFPPFQRRPKMALNVSN